MACLVRLLPLTCLLLIETPQLLQGISREGGKITALWAYITLDPVTKQHQQRTTTQLRLAEKSLLVRDLGLMSSNAFEDRLS
jgi:hypothetical protein